MEGVEVAPLARAGKSRKTPSPPPGPLRHYSTPFVKWDSDSSVISEREAATFAALRARLDGPRGDAHSLFHTRPELRGYEYVTVASEARAALDPSRGRRGKLSIDRWPGSLL